MKTRFGILAALGLALLSGSGIASDRAAVTYRNGEGMEAEIILHAGVRLGMTHEEVYNLEAGKGNAVTEAYYKNVPDALTLDEARTIDSFYYTGRVAGIDGGRAAFSFRRDLQDALYWVQYRWEEKAEDPMQAFRDMEERLDRVYGRADYSGNAGTIWEKSGIERDWAPDASFLKNGAEYQLAYSQRVLTGSDGSVILIEHLLNKRNETDSVVYIWYGPEDLSAFKISADDPDGDW